MTIYQIIGGFSLVYGAGGDGRKIVLEWPDSEAEEQVKF
jgi:hypothetical protein